MTNTSAPPEPEADRPSIAVLPFVSSSDDKDSEILADGMTDDVISLLARVPGFFVTSRGSTFAYKGQSHDARQAGRELGVRYVVEGSVRRSDEKVRVNAELVEARTGEQIWAERFEGDLSDIFALQDAVAQGIVGQLEPELMWAEGRRSSRIPTEDLDAWTLLHSARMRFQVGHSREALEEAIRLAETALEKDPNYAEAHGYLVDIILNRVTFRWSDDREGDTELAAYHCRRALELDPESPIVLYGATVFSLYTGHPDVALGRIERCCEVNPNDAFGQGMRGFVLGLSGRGEEGLDAVDQALRLSPRDRRTFFLVGWKSYTYMMLERYEEAEQLARQSIGLYDGFIWMWLSFLTTLAMRGKMAEAETALSEVKKMAPGYELADWAQTLKTWQGNPTGERGTLIDRQIDSLRDIWPS